jgi:hypothetical protein
LLYLGKPDKAELMLDQARQVLNDGTKSTGQD